MKIRALRLENFRQFYGEQNLAFAEDDQKNVTIVYGANGAGKTTLLNAFTWTLYGKFSAGFEQPEKIINERACSEVTGAGVSVSARVEIEFEHEDLLYTARRVTTDRRADDGSFQRLKNGELSLEYIGEDGRLNRPDNPGDRINQILPERLHAFFFFNGERIEALAKESAYDEIETGIKNLLGLEIVDRAIRHLDGPVRRRLQTELHEVGSREMQQALDAETNLREAIERKQEDQQAAKRNEQGWRRELDEVHNRLRTLDEAKGLQEQRDLLDGDLTRIKGTIAGIRQELARHTSQRGYLAFTRALCERCDAILQEKRRRGEIPTGIKQQFVQDLLEQRTCICGTCLRPGEEPHAMVEAWLGKAGSNEVEEATIRMSGQVLNFARQREEMFTTLDGLLERLQEQRSSRRRTEEKLSEITRKLSGKDSEEIRGLENRRDQLIQKSNEEHRRFGVLATELKELERQYKEQTDKVKKLEAANTRAKVAQRRLQVCDEATDLFREIFQSRVREVREKLEERVQSIYSSISYKPYTPVLTEDYHLLLQKRVGDQNDIVAKSTGENQILSLAFIGAIADIARERYRRARERPTEGMLAFRGGIYPVVMDSPFGSLDENYRTQIAKAVPTLAPQTIVFVSKSQGLGGVLDELGPRAGRTYVLTYHTSKQVEPESLELNNRRMPYIKVSSNGTESVEIKEIT